MWEHSWAQKGGLSPLPRLVEEAVGHKELAVRSVECAEKCCVKIFSNLGPEWRWKPRARAWCLCVEDMSQDPGGCLKQ